jgi:hypothetical protein
MPSLAARTYVALQLKRRIVDSAQDQGVRGAADGDQTNPILNLDPEECGPAASIEPPQEWIVVVTGMDLVSFALFQVPGPARFSQKVRSRWPPSAYPRRLWFRMW